MTTVVYVVFIISTTVFMRRGGYSWLAAGLTGFFSPLAFIVLFAALLLPLSVLVGRLGISEERLPHDLLTLLVAIAIVVAWCVSGFFLSRRATRRHQSDGL